MKEGHVYHLITPGIDSLCAYFYIKYLDIDVTPVHIVLSPKYGAIEREKLLDIDSSLISDIKFMHASGLIKEYDNGFVNSRNLLLATILDASGVIKEDKKPALISFGFNKDDRVYDSTVEYCDNMSKILSEGLRVKSFVRDFTKEDLAKWFLLNTEILDYSKRVKILKNTYSCYSGKEEECLECNACFRKSVLLHNLGIELRIVKNSKFLKERLKILDDETVSSGRKKSIISYLYFLTTVNKVLSSEDTSDDGCHYSDIFKTYLGGQVLGNQDKE